MYGVCQCSLHWVTRTCIYHTAFVVVRMCIESMGILFVTRFELHSIAQPGFVRVSLSISELHEHAYSHCSLLWCEKGTVYQQVIRVLVSYH